MRDVQLITGPDISCANWQIEAALRMLHNNIVQGAKPAELIIYGGGKAARSWECFDAIVKTLRELKPDETLLIQSGKPVGVLKTFEHSPRVLIVNSMLVPQWCYEKIFWPLEEKGMTMYGQMTAGSWAYIGQQGIMQGTFETFGAAGAKPGKLIFSAGLGNMGGAQAPAGKMNGATTLIVEIDPGRISRCQKEGWIDEVFVEIEPAIKRALAARERKESVAIALQANVVDVLDYLVSHGIVPDIVTDQTAAHHPKIGYFPQRLSFEESLEMRKKDPDYYLELCLESIFRHVARLVNLQNSGATVFDYGNGIRRHAFERGLESAFNIKGFVPLYVRPLFCEGRGPFRVAALSGDPADIAVIDKIILDFFPDNAMLVNWIHKVQKAIDFSKQPGLPARVCWLGQGERKAIVEAIWWALRKGELKAPIWVGRDHLDCGSVASPDRETESMIDGSDFIADWPILNALVACSSGATWVSVHDGGGVGIGKAIHAGQCFVITPDASCLSRATRVFTNDPATGIIRHADAGYPEAIKAAKKHGIIIPMPKE
ncbi:MAG: urocanate hydratase [Patescibacteria group bacterium]